MTLTYVIFLVLCILFIWMYSMRQKRQNQTAVLSEAVRQNREVNHWLLSTSASQYEKRNEILNYAQYISVLINSKRISEKDAKNIFGGFIIMTYEKYQDKNGIEKRKDFLLLYNRWKKKLPSKEPVQ